MKPTALRPRIKVRRADQATAPVLTFVARDAARGQSTLQADAYRGLAGPDDQGFVQVSDWDMARKYTRVSD